MGVEAPCISSLAHICRFAIDDSADFTSVEPQVRALADASPEARSRLNTTMSVRSNAPQASGDLQAKTKKGGKGKDGQGKERRRESGGGDGKRKKQKI